MLLAMMSVTAVVLLLFGVPASFVVTRFVDEDAMARFERVAALAARAVPVDFETRGYPPKLLPVVEGIFVAVYDQAGRLAAGSGPPVADAAATRALANQVSGVERSDSRIVAIPLTEAGHVSGVLRMEQSTARSDARTGRIVIGLGLLGLAVSTVIGFVLALVLARPVRRLRDRAARLGEGDFTIDRSSCRIPELAKASRMMDDAARRPGDAGQRHAYLSAGESHQLRTPLAGLRVGIETELQFPRADHTEILREALSDVERLEQAITDLLARRADLGAEAVETGRRPSF